MPCHDPRDEPRAELKLVLNETTAYQHEVSRLAARCNLLTNLLCQAGRAHKNKTEIPPGVLSWWDEHCAADAQRGEPW